MATGQANQVQHSVTAGKTGTAGVGESPSGAANGLHRAVRTLPLTIYPRQTGRGSPSAHHSSGAAESAAVSPRAEQRGQMTRTLLPLLALGTADSS